MWIQNQQDDNSVAVPVILQTNMRHQKQIPRRLSLRRSKQEYRHCGKKKLTRNRAFPRSGRLPHSDQDG